MRAVFLTFIIAIGFLAALTNNAAAQIVRRWGVQRLYDCTGDKIYDADSKDAPEVIAHSFAGEGRKIVFRMCRDLDGNVHYFIRKPRPNRNGVCRIFESEIFPGSETDFVIVDTLYNGTAPNWSFDMKGWKGVPPEAWTLMRYAPRSAILGFVTHESCPLGDDTRYIPVHDASDGLLTSFQTYWDQITQSPQTLRAAIQDVPTISTIKNVMANSFDATPSQNLRDAFVSAVTEGHDRIGEIACGTSGFRAILKDQIVGFDVGPTGIKLTYLSVVLVA